MDIVLKSRYEVCLQKDDQNTRPGNRDEQPSYVITPESCAPIKMAIAGRSKSS